MLNTVKHNMFLEMVPSMVSMLNSCIKQVHLTMRRKTGFISCWNKLFKRFYALHYMIHLKRPMEATTHGAALDSVAKFSKVGSSSGGY